MILKIIIGLVFLILLIFALRVLAKTHPRNILRFLKIVGIVVLAILVIYLLATGKFLAAMGGVTGIISLLVRWGILWKQLNSLFSFKRTAEHGKERLIEMSKMEALEVLGLKENCSQDDVKSAHKKLIKNIHPDQGGSDWLAAKNNRAKDILLGS